MDNQDQSKNQEDFPRGDKENDPYSQNLPTLSDLLVGFQKSMARVAQDTARATKEDPLFLYGRRNLYYIDQLDVDTVVRITPDIDPEKEAANFSGSARLEMILITPPNEPSPYKVPCGPRNTSTLSTS